LEHVARITDDKLDASFSRGKGDIARLLANMKSTYFGPEECIRTLSMAVSNGQDGFVCLLLKAAVKDYDSLLDTAISEGHMGRLRLLLVTGARSPVNSTRHWGYARFRAEACESGDLKVLETLICSGANPNEDIE
jgi:hypothetical protein